MPDVVGKDAGGNVGAHHMSLQYLRSSQQFPPIQQLRQ